MGANLNVKKWSRGFTSRRVEVIELESGEVLKNIVSLKVSTPTFELDTENETLEISCATDDALILYQVNDGDWTVYSDAISVEDEDEVKAFAVLADNIPSDEAEFTVELE